MYRRSEHTQKGEMSANGPAEKARTADTGSESRLLLNINEGRCGGSITPHPACQGHDDLLSTPHPRARKLRKTMNIRGGRTRLKSSLLDRPTATTTGVEETTECEARKI